MRRRRPRPRQRYRAGCGLGPAARPGCRCPAPGRRPWPPASRNAGLRPCRRWRPARSCRGGACECARSIPRTGCAPAGRRRWWVRRGSTDPDRGSAHSTSRASVSCRRTACPPGVRQTAPGRCFASGRQSAPCAPAHPGRTGGRRSRGSRTRSGSGRDSCPGPGACRRCAGRRRGGGRHRPCRRRAPAPGPAAACARRRSAPAGWTCRRWSARRRRSPAGRDRAVARSWPRP